MHLLGGVWGHAPQEIFGILDILRSIRVHFGTFVAEPPPSLDLIPAPHVQDSKPVDDTMDDLLSLEHCSESPRYYCTSMTLSAMP